MVEEAKARPTLIHRSRNPVGSDSRGRDLTQLDEI